MDKLWLMSSITEKEVIEIINYIKNTPDYTYQSVMEIFKIKRHLLYNIRKKYQLPIPKNRENIRRAGERVQRGKDMIDFIKNNPASTFAVISEKFKFNRYQIRIMLKEAGLPMFSDDIYKRTEKEEKRFSENRTKRENLDKFQREVADYIKSNRDLTYDDFCEKFSLKRHQISHIRKKYNLLPIKRPKIVQKNVDTSKKKCVVCKEMKPIEDFNFYKSQTCYCFSCKESYGQRTKERIRNRKFGTIERMLYNRVKDTKQRKKWENNLTPSYLLEIYHKQKGNCFYSGIKMITDRSDLYALSIDRIDSMKGYIKGNIVLCCNIINQMKSNLSVDEFLKICGTITLHSQI